MDEQPQPAQPRREDADHIKLLAIFHFIFGVVVTLTGCVPVVYLVGALLVATGVIEVEVPELVGIIFTVFSSVALLGFWGVGIAVLVAGRCLARRVHYTFCLVIGCVCCLFFPLGTVLGVFTIVVLMRPTVKPLFDERTDALGRIG